MQHRKRTLRTRAISDLSPFDVLGEPRLLDEEERRAYYKLRDFLEQSLRPKAFSEYHEISDFAWRRVKQLRLEAAEIDLLESPFIMMGQLAFVCGENLDKAQQLALDYCGPDAAKAVAAADTIEKGGLSSSQLRGNAISLNLGKLELLDRLMQSMNDLNRRSTKVFSEMIARQSATLQGDNSVMPLAAKVYGAERKISQPSVKVQQNRRLTVR